MALLMYQNANTFDPRRLRCPPPIVFNGRKKVVDHHACLTRCLKGDDEIFKQAFIYKSGKLLTFYDRSLISGCQCFL